MPDATAQTVNTVQSNDSAPFDMPSSAPEAPKDTVTPPLAKDDNLAQNVPESQPVETPQTAQTGEIPLAPEQKSESVQAQPTPPETQSAQLPPSDPIPESVQTDSVSNSVFSPSPAPAVPVPSSVSSKPNLARDLLNKARQVIQNRKQKKIDRVMDLFAKRINITNDEVEKFLHVSDATATRYLEILEKENKIRQSGKTGKGVVYTKI